MNLGPQRQGLWRAEGFRPCLSVAVPPTLLFQPSQLSRQIYELQSSPDSTTLGQSH